MNSIILTIHIAGGATGILTGLASLFLKKGGSLHNKSGNLFFIAMLFMSATGALLSLSPISMTSFLAGSITFYMVATGWRTARNRSGQTDRIDHIWMGYILLISLSGITSCILLLKGQGSLIGGGTDAGLDFFLFFYTGIAILALLLDIRVFTKGGIHGAQRVARHLWRMCFGLWVAIGSFFLGQPQVFPEPLKSSILLRSIPFILVTLMLFFWLIRVYVIRQFKLKST